MKLLLSIIIFTALITNINGQCSLPICASSNCTPDANIGFEPQGGISFCVGQEIFLENLSDDNFDQFIIDWGDGQVDTINTGDIFAIQSHIYTDLGYDNCTSSSLPFEICFIGQEFCSNGETCQKGSYSFELKLPPTSSFEAEKSICFDNQIEFFNSSCSASSYFWEFGDGTSSTEANPIHTYPATGEYIVSLRVSNGCGSHSSSQTIQVVNYPNAIIDYGITGGELCGPGTQTVSVIGNQWFSGPLSTFSWNVTPSYDDINGSWCFVDPNQGGVCLQDSLFTENTLDSLLRLNNLELYFNEPGEYIFSLDYNNACGEFSTSDTVVVYEQPIVKGKSSVTGCDNVELCFDELNLELTGDYTDFRWEFTNTSLSTSEQLDFGCLTFNQPSQLSLSLFAESPCVDINFIVDIIVVNTQNVNIPNPDPEILCSYSEPVLLLPSSSGGTYFFGQDTAQFIQNDTLYPDALSPGIYDIIYILSDNPDCPAQDTFNFTIQEGPSVTLGVNDPFCEEIIGFNPEISSFGGDIDFWSWALCDTTGAQVLTGTTQDPEFDFSQTGVFEIKVNVSSNECGTVSDAVELIIQENENVIISGFEGFYCQGSGLDTLNAFPLGGEWSGDGITNNELGIFDPSALNPGIYQYSYSVDNGPCSSADTIELEIVSSAIVEIQDTFTCFNSAPFSISAAPSGGSFQGTGIVDSGSGIFDPAQAQIGINSVQYTYVDINSCEIVSSLIVEVDSLPNLSTVDVLTLCIDDSGIDLISLLEFEAQSDIGDFIFSGEGISNAEGVFNSDNLSPGLYPIEFDYYGRSCQVSGQFDIEIIAKQLLIIPDDTLICVSDSILSLEANISGGQWSSPDCSIDPVSGEINISNLGDINCSFSYTLNQGTSCEQTKSLVVTIEDLNDDLSVPPNESICYSSERYTLNGFEPDGGIWSGEAILDEDDGIINVEQLKQDTTYVYTYCIMSSEIDCEACLTTSLSIEALPVAVFETPDTVCISEDFLAVNTSELAVSYIWNTGNGITFNEKEPVFNYQQGDNYTISLIAENSFGCRDTMERNIYVIAPPVLDLVVTTLEGCAPLELEYSNNSFGESSTYSWSFDGIDTLFESSPNIVLDSVFTDSVITVQFKIENICGILKSDHDVLVHPYPIADFGINDDEGCSPDTVFISNITLGNPESLFWDFGNGVSSMEFDPPFQVYSTPDDSISQYTISLAVQNECGTDYIEKNVEVFPNNVEAFFEIDTLMGCPPLEISIQNYSTPGSTVSYDFGNGSSSINNIEFYTYNEPGEYIITQYASLCGVDSIKSKPITVFALPLLDFEFPNSICPGDSVLFRNYSTGSVSFIWDFDDMSESDKISPVHVFAEPGEYLVQLIGYSQLHACPDTLSKIITVNEIPFSTFVPDKMTICAGESLSFQNESTGATDFSWSFGDGTGSTDTNPIHVFNTAGSFLVQLEAFNESACSNLSAGIVVRVNPKPLADFNLSSSVICQFHDTLVIENNSIESSTNYWYINNELAESQALNLEYYSNDIGSTDIKLISENAFGCQDSISKQITVLPSPVSFSNIIDTAGCEVLSLDFKDLSLNSNLTTWKFTEFNSSNDPETTFEFSQDGIYEVLLIAGNSNGCPSDTNAINIEVFPRAVADFEIMGFDSCQSHVEISIDNLSQNSSDYQWTLPGENTSIEFEPLFEIDDPGSYSISLISSNVYNCSDTTLQEYTIFPQPKALFDFPDNCICEGDSILFINNSVNANNFNFLLNGSESFEMPLVIDDVGDYSISLISGYDDKCFDTLTSSLFLTVYSSPLSSFSALVNESQSVIGDVQFINQSNNAEAYLWEFGDGNTSNDSDPFHEYDINGPVSVCLYSYAFNNGECECVDKEFQIIDIERINTFYVPNALSPGQTFGNNEVGLFKPKGIGIESYELNIYSPWGDLIKTLNRVVEGSPKDYWDGTDEGEPVPQGAYLWKANIKFLSGHSEFKQGTITVIR